MTDATTHGAVDMGSFFYNGEEWYTKDYADEVIAGLQSRLTDWQASQGYRYIGKDGKSVLARDLEDERDALRAEVERLREALNETVSRVDFAMSAFHHTHQWTDDYRKIAGHELPDNSDTLLDYINKPAVQAHGEPDAAEGK